MPVVDWLARHLNLGWAGLCRAASAVSGCWAYAGWFVIHLQCSSLAIAVPHWLEGPLLQHCGTGCGRQTVLCPHCVSSFISTTVLLEAEVAALALTIADVLWHVILC
jgi:hypothetical protein